MGSGDNILRNNEDRDFAAVESDPPRMPNDDDAGTSTASRSRCVMTARGIGHARGRAHCRCGQWTVMNYQHGHGRPPQRPRRGAAKKHDINNDINNNGKLQTATSTKGGKKRMRVAVPVLVPSSMSFSMPLSLSSSSDAINNDSDGNNNSNNNNNSSHNSTRPPRSGHGHDGHSPQTQTPSPHRCSMQHRGRSSRKHHPLWLSPTTTKAVAAPAPVPGMNEMEPLSMLHMQDPIQHRDCSTIRRRSYNALTKKWTPWEVLWDCHHHRHHQEQQQQQQVVHHPVHGDHMLQQQQQQLQDDDSKLSDVDVLGDDHQRTFSDASRISISMYPMSVPTGGSSNTTSSSSTTTSTTTTPVSVTTLHLRKGGSLRIYPNVIHHLWSSSSSSSSLSSQPQSLTTSSTCHHELPSLHQSSQDDDHDDHVGGMMQHQNNNSNSNAQSSMITMNKLRQEILSQHPFRQYRIHGGPEPRVQFLAHALATMTPSSDDEHKHDEHDHDDEYHHSIEKNMTTRMKQQELGINNNHNNSSKPLQVSSTRTKDQEGAASDDNDNEDISSNNNAVVHAVSNETKSENKKKKLKLVKKKSTSNNQSKRQSSSSLLPLLLKKSNPIPQPGYRYSGTAVTLKARPLQHFRLLQQIAAYMATLVMTMMAVTTTTKSSTTTSPTTTTTTCTAKEEEKEKEVLGVVEEEEEEDATSGQEHDDNDHAPRLPNDTTTTAWTPQYLLPGNDFKNAVPMVTPPPNSNPTKDEPTNINQRQEDHIHARQLPLRPPVHDAAATMTLQPPPVPPPDYHDALTMATPSSSSQIIEELFENAHPAPHHITTMTTTAVALAARLSPPDDEYKEHASSCSNRNNNNQEEYWNMGAHVIAYRDGHDQQGMHADNDQNEDQIVCLIVSSPTHHPRRIRIIEQPQQHQQYQTWSSSNNKQVARTTSTTTTEQGDEGSEKKEHGQEEFELYLHAGDAYEMDAIMQRHYLHGVPRDRHLVQGPLQKQQHAQHEEASRVNEKASHPSSTGTSSFFLDKADDVAALELLDLSHDGNYSSFLQVAEQHQLSPTRIMQNETKNCPAPTPVTTSTTTTISTVQFDDDSDDHDKHTASERFQRMVVVFRRGQLRYFDHDSGTPVPDLTPSPPKERWFGDNHSQLVLHRKYLRRDLIQYNLHGRQQGGISGNKVLGCDAIIVSNRNAEFSEAYDFMDRLGYMASRNNGAMSLDRSWEKLHPIRVFRSCQVGALTADQNRYRYDGLYYVWDKTETNLYRNNIQRPANKAFIYHMHRAHEHPPRKKRKTQSSQPDYPKHQHLETDVPVNDMSFDPLDPAPLHLFQKVKLPESLVG